MFKRLRELWRILKGEPARLIPVEVALPEYTPEERNDILAALATHPGFQLLIGELHNLRAKTELMRPALKPPKSLDDMIANTVAQVEFDTKIRERQWLENRVLAALQAVQSRNQNPLASQE